MRKTLRAALLAALGALLIGSPALAGTLPLKTYDFTFSTGWLTVFGSPLPVTATGSFTGYLEPNGFINQSDLTAFTAMLNNPVMGSFPFPTLDLFSFNPAGGVSTLDFIASASSAHLCAGAAVTFSLTCNAAGTNPGTAHAAFIASGELAAYTPSFAEVTLVPSPAPEPATWTMLLIGLAGVGLARRRRGVLSPA